MLFHTGDKMIPHDSPLQEAERLFRAGQKVEALRLVKSVLAADRRNVDAWWLAARAAPSQEEARVALRVVLKLQPDRADARAALERLEAAIPPAPPPASNNPLSARPSIPRASQKRGCLSSRKLLWAGVTVISIALLNCAILFLIGNLMGGFRNIPGVGSLPLAAQMDRHLINPVAATSTPGALAHNAQITGNIRDGEMQEFRFSGRPGTLMFVGIGFATVSQDADTRGSLDLIDPDGYRVASSAAGIEGIEMPQLPLLNMGAFSFLQCELDAAGIWKVRINGQAGRSAGTYIMMMQCYPEQNCLPPR